MNTIKWYLQDTTRTCTYECIAVRIVWRSPYKLKLDQIPEEVGVKTLSPSSDVRRG